MEYLRDLLAEHKRNRPPPAVLNGWFRLSQDFLGTLKRFVAYLISKAIGFSRYVAKLWSLHHIPGYRIS